MHSIVHRSLFTVAPQSETTVPLDLPPIVRTLLDYGSCVLYCKVNEIGSCRHPLPTRFERKKRSCGLCSSSFSLVMDSQLRHLPTRREHALGITLSVVVAHIWVGSSELIQFVLGSTDFNKPYFFTYLTTCTFASLALGFLRKSWRESIYAPSAREKNDYAPVAARATVVQFNARDTARVAAVIAPLYLAANWVFNAALPMTSVASSSTISTTSSLFTLAFSVAAGVETFSWLKVCACCVTILGTAIITGVDADGGENQAWGDGLSILAAATYGLYTTTLKRSCPNSQIIDMGMMLAFMGLFVCVFGWPVVPLLNVTRIEKFELPSRRTLVLIGVNALIGSVLSDFLWAKSVVLTSALVGTIALSLTVPLSLIFDVLFKGKHITPTYALGVVLVLTGFVVVNLDLARQETGVAEEDMDEE